MRAFVIPFPDSLKDPNIMAPPQYEPSTTLGKLGEDPLGGLVPKSLAPQIFSEPRYIFLGSRVLKSHGKRKGLLRYCCY